MTNKSNSKKAAYQKGRNYSSGQTPRQNLFKKPLPEDPRFLGAIIVILIFLAFFPSLKNDFIKTWDDNAYVTQNPIIQNLSLRSVGHMFSKQVNGTYVPLPLLTYSIEFTLFGLHPFPFHMINLIIHIISALLVFRLFRLLKINIFYAAFGAVLFGIHPMRVESVSWISERKDVLYALFYMAALVTHVKFNLGGESSKKYYRLTLLFFFLSLLSKIEAVTLPLSLLLIDYLMERPLKLNLLSEKIPHFAMSLLFGCLGIFILNKVGLLSVNRELGFIDRFFYGILSLNIYIVKFIVPYIQSTVYPYPVMPGKALPLYCYLSPLLTLGLAFLIFITAKYTKVVVFGALFFLVNVIFMLQILAAGNAFLSDRYTYVAYTGLIFITIWSLEQLTIIRIGIKPFIRFGMAAVVFIFIFLTYVRCETWKNSETLWTQVIEKFPHQNVASYTNRGIYYSTEGQWDNALSDLSEAIIINPKYAVSYANRGIVYGDLGQTEKAISDFTKAIDLEPTYKLVYHNRGVAYGDLGQYDKAISDFSKAIKLDAKYASAYNNLSLIYCKKNQLDSAIMINLKGLKMNPENPVLQAGLGRCYLDKNDIVNAEVQFRKCLEISDQNLDALLGMAVVSYLKQEISYANGYINQAQTIAPALSAGMNGIESLERAGYYFPQQEKEVLSKLFFQMR